MRAEGFASNLRFAKLTVSENGLAFVLPRCNNGRDKYSTMLLDAAFINSDLSETNAAQDSQRVVDVSEATRGIAKTGWLDLATKISRTSDILPIDDETGEGCFAFSHKAFRSLGCPTPADFYYKQKLSNPNPHQQHGTTRG